MEELYPPENFGSSNQFPLVRYFEEFHNIFSSEVPSVVKSDENETEYLTAIKDLMGVNLDLKSLKLLSQKCSIDHLTSEGENNYDFPISVPPTINSSSKLPYTFFTSKKDSSLEVNKCKLDLQLKAAEDQISLKNKRNYYQKIEFQIPPTLPDLTPGSDFLVSIYIYKPFAFKYFSAKNASEKLRFNHEIIAIGQNTLTELRDAIVCSLDEGLFKEVESTSVDLEALGNPQSIYPSGCFFIENTFYNDFRAADAVDYSTPVLEWAKKKKIKNLQSTSMEGVRIDNLTPRFGYPYLYMHQGECEHLLVFTDARLLNNDDCLHSECYPHMLKVNRQCNKMCLLCTVTLAKWICVGSDRFPQNKVFLCTDCCNSYNYINGKKIGNFQLYPYYQKPLLRRGE